MNKLYKKLDTKLTSINGKIQKHLLGRALLRLFEGIILAILISSAFLLFSFIKQNIMEEQNFIEKIYSLEIGVNEQYLDNLLGDAKYITYYAGLNIFEKFYILDGVAIRTLYKDNCLEAYFITITDEKRTGSINLGLYDHIVDKKSLGQFNYSIIPGAPRNVIGVLQNGTGYFCYVENYNFGSSGNYRTFIFANLPYGIQNIELDSFKNFNSDEEIKQAEAVDVTFIYLNRATSKPDTYGIIGHNIANEDAQDILFNWNDIDYRALIN